MVIVLCILTYVVGLSIYNAVQTYGIQNRLLTDGISAAGHLVNWQVSGSGRSRQRKALVEFRTAADEVIQTVTDMNTSAILGFSAGDSLHVRYNPSNPSECSIDEPMLLPLWLKLTLLILAWLTLLIGGCIVTWQNW
ncbi:DUF3592 domain-containing protein [Hymenobacter rigui]|uniref:DUF3592 domain-containing protein n=1 Tax=Hymenobacter rigui TaxID=334424 RepID=A0A428KTE2_9BACT|nr:DUF3592 domain-containing protein [Hymenobacter rigui]